MECKRYIPEDRIPPPPEYPFDVRKASSLEEFGHDNGKSSPFENSKPCHITDERGSRQADKNKSSEG
jgi:hypothetical protein